MSHRARTPSITTITVSITALATTYFLTKSIRQYGLSGTLRYIWEGDHLPPEIRSEIDKMDDLQKQIKMNKKKMNKVVVLIETAKLNSVDEIETETETEMENENETQIQRQTNNSQDLNTSKDSSNTTPGTESNENAMLKKRHYILSQYPNLKKDIGLISYNLDKLAAEVDAVQSYGNEDVRRRKKEMSSLVVDMMGTCDGFMAECGVEMK